jgi:hypothetical protein
MASYNLWNGFVRGLYREHATNVIDNRCFGSWVVSNLTHLDDIFENLFDFNFNISYEDAKEASVDIVNLIYKNNQYCQFYRVYNDLTIFSGNFDDASDTDLINGFMANVKTNLI